jgi:hypothetical protein
MAHASEIVRAALRHNYALSLQYDMDLIGEFYMPLKLMSGWAGFSHGMLNVIAVIERVTKPL